MIVKSARFLKSAQSPADFPRDGLPQIAVAGRSNVGKSSLLNMLVQRKGLVKTSQTPGKTRLINFFLINEGGPEPAFHLVDIPGFGYAQAGRDTRHLMEEAIEGYLRKSGHIAGILYLVDIRLPDNRVDREALEWLTGFDLPLLVIATKGDKLGKGKVRDALEEIARIHGLPQLPLLTSTLAKTGREEVMEQVGILLEPPSTGE